MPDIILSFFFFLLNLFLLDKLFSLLCYTHEAYPIPLWWHPWNHISFLALKWNGHCLWPISVRLHWFSHVACRCGFITCQVSFKNFRGAHCQTFCFLTLPKMIFKCMHRLCVCDLDQITVLWFSKQALLTPAQIISKVFLKIRLDIICESILEMSKPSAYMGY